MWPALAKRIGGEALVKDPRFATHQARGARQAELDAAFAIRYVHQNAKTREEQERAIQALRALQRVVAIEPCRIPAPVN